MLNALWIMINLMCLVLTMYHLHKLYKDFTQSNLEAVRIASLFTNMLSITTAEVCNSQCSTVVHYVQVQLFYCEAEVFTDISPHEL